MSIRLPAILALLIFIITPAFAADTPQKTFRGVVTYHLIPAHVMRINRIVTDPKPGTSVIGDESLLVEVAENPEVMANWTVVEVTYASYPAPKTITYELFGEQHQVTVTHHAVAVEVVGDLSPYLE